MKTLQTIYQGNIALPDDTLAVALHHYGEHGLEHAGIAEHEINPDFMRTLADFVLGDEVFYQSPDTTDCLDNTSVEAERATRIWWMGTVLAESPRGER